jgi:protein SCO1/2
MTERGLRLLVACALLGAVSAAPAAQLTAPVLPAEIASVDWAQKLGAQVPLDARFTLATEEGSRDVALGELVHDVPVVLALVYYECPMLCNLVLEGLVRGLRALDLEVGSEFDVVVLGIDPGESVELARAARASLLEEYGREASAGGWHVLLGSEASIDAVAGAVGFDYVYVPETDEYSHAAGICVLTPDGVLSRIFYGTEFAPRDLKFGLMEASDGAIGSPIEKVVLRCFLYDPARGQYGFAVMGALRVTGVATVALLILFIVRTVRRDRRRATAASRARAEGASAA